MDYQEINYPIAVSAEGAEGEEYNYGLRSEQLDTLIARNLLKEDFLVFYSTPVLHKLSTEM
ncbi:hypothetical protein NIES2107_18630 [Nostoc carneum NIES-2107]|nr:hypothetical protein NIES2107_18630 [Nostoc carneum NIES-2107]